MKDEMIALKFTKEAQTRYPNGDGAYRQFEIGDVADFDDWRGKTLIADGAAIEVPYNKYLAPHDFDFESGGEIRLGIRDLEYSDRGASLYLKGYAKPMRIEFDTLLALRAPFEKAAMDNGASYVGSDSWWPGREVMLSCAAAEEGDAGAVKNRKSPAKAPTYLKLAIRPALRHAPKLATVSIEDERAKRLADALALAIDGDRKQAAATLRLAADLLVGNSK
jgi:hypothetical protein